IALLSALAAVPAADPVQAAVLLALMVGLVQTGITLLRLGDLTRFISHAVIVGFTVGAGVLLVLDQTKNLLRLTAPRAADGPFLLRFWHPLAEGGPIHPWTAMIGLGTVALVLALRWLNRRLGRRVLPEFLAAVFVMALAVWAGGLDARGVQ